MSSHHWQDNSLEPPGYEEALLSGPYGNASGASNDPRDASSESLVTEREPEDRRRKLLLIYIHGFQGDETSFKSFPAHVHNLVTILLAGSHTVHTKIYPKYRARSQLSAVAEHFSNWLQPHEGPNVDVILLGHSMGGLLSAEVTLLTPVIPPPPTTALRHGLLGTINFDVPFLGMHPSVVSSGIASIFKPAASPPSSPHLNAQGEPSSASQSTTSIDTLPNAPPNRYDTLFSPPQDPNFNPKFANDTNLAFRKGWRSTMHFINKHSDHLRTATKQYVKSHVEFGGAMADYRQLHARYNRLRALEEDEEVTRKRAMTGSASDTVLPIPRVRFINYYTCCIGRPKKPKPVVEDGSRSGSQLDVSTSASQLDLSANQPAADARSLSASSPGSSLHSVSPRPSISVEEVRGDTAVPVPLDEPFSPTNASTGTVSNEDATPANTHTEPAAANGLAPIDTALSSAVSLSTTTSADTHAPLWPVLGPLPLEPSPPDLARVPNRYAQVVLKREYDREMKVWKQIIKDREDNLKERKRAEEKIAKLSEKGKDEKKKNKTDKENDKDKENTQAESSGAHDATPRPSVSTSTAPSTAQLSTLSPTSTIATTATATTAATNTTTDPSKPSKPPKERHFCVLPSKNAAGERDPTWQRVFMGQVDEVGAHCGIFEMNETYERLVGEVGAKIEEWVSAVGGEWEFE